MTRTLLSAISIIALMGAPAALAGDLSLFGVNSLNGTAGAGGAGGDGLAGSGTTAGADGGDGGAGGNAGVSNARTGAIMVLGAANPIFSQQATGLNEVTATLTVTNTNGVASGDNVLTQTGDTAGVSVVNKDSATANDSETNNLLTITNMATNASATFVADNVDNVLTIGGTDRTAHITTASTQGETFVAQQVAAEAATSATANFTDAVTKNTSISNMATGAGAVISLSR